MVTIDTFCLNNPVYLLPYLLLRLIVGAPVADSSFYPRAKNPGAIYNCSVLTSQCEQLHVGRSSLSHLQKFSFS